MTKWNDILKIERYERATAEEFAVEDMDEEPIEYKWKRHTRQEMELLRKTLGLIQNLYNNARREKDAELVKLYKTTQDGLIRAIERLKA